MGTTHEVPDFIARAIAAQGKTTPEEVARKLADGEPPHPFDDAEPEPPLVLEVGPIEPETAP